MDPDETSPATGQEAPTGKTFTEDEVNKLLTRERDKLHGRIDSTKTRLEEMQATVASLQQESADRAKAEETARKAAEKLAREKAQAEMSAKDLIDARTKELQAEREALENQWAEKFTGLETQIATERAIFAKEQAMNELRQYTQSAVTAAGDEIVPELTRFINGNTKEEVDAQIAQAREATASIVAGIQQAQVAARAAMPGVSPTGFAPTGPLDTQDASRQLSAADIQNMSMAEYQKMRGQFGTAGAGTSKGLFG